MYEGKTRGSYQKKIVCVLALAALTVCTVFFSGCDIAKKVPFVGKLAEKAGLGSDYIFRVGSQKCGAKEARIILMNYQKEYGEVYGINLWDHDYGDGESLEEYVKALTLSQLAQVYTLDVIAEEMEVALSEEEQEQTAQAAKVYFTGLSEQEEDYLDAEETDAEDLYERYVLAQKLYSQLTEEIDTEVSDDEARVMQAKQIFTADAGRAQDYLNQLNGGADFDALAASGSEAPAVDVNLDRSMFEEDVSAQIFALQDGQTSGVIPADDGYYIFFCVKAYDPALTEANKANVLEKRMSDSVEGTYARYAKETGSSLREEAWQEVKVDTSLRPEGSSFMEIYEKYFGTGAAGMQ